MFLRQKSVDATEADKQVVTDLLDTLRANLDRCVGMAANMIGVKKNYCCGSWTISVCNDQSGDHKEERTVRDGRGMSFAERCEIVHEVPGDRGGLPGSEFCQEAWKIFWMDSTDHTA